MMPLQPPVLDKRDTTAVAEEVRRRLGWAPAPGDTLREALIAIFAHDCGHLLKGLNAAPQRQFETFVDHLRPTQRAAVPAHTVLVFEPVPRPAGAGPAALVPAGTAVAGPVPPGAREPLVFETLAPLTLSAARPVRAFVGDPGLARWADAAAALGLSAGGADPEGTAGSGSASWVSVPWSMHLALPDGLPLLPETRVQLRLDIDGEPSWPAGTRIEWILRGEAAAVPLVPESDGTAGLTQGGEIVFKQLPAWPQTPLAGRVARWIGCRLIADGPLVRPPRPVLGQNPEGAGRTVAAARLPARLLAATVRLRTDLPPQAAEAVFWSGTPLDASRDFYPLGERPRFGDAFLIKSLAFAQPGALLRLDVRLTNPADGAAPAPIATVATDHAPALHWDAWGAAGWARVGHVKDGTQGLTRSGTVVLTLPADTRPATLQGLPGGWLRGWLARGDYAVEPRPGGTSTPIEAAMLALRQAEHRPPSIAQLSIAASLQSPESAVGPVVIERGLTLTVQDLQDVAIGLAPQSPDEPATLYVGLALPSAPAVQGERLQFVLQLPGGAPQSADADAVGSAVTPTHWQYRAGGGWVDAAAQPLPSAQPLQPAVAVTAGGDWTRWKGSTVDEGLYWLRVLRADSASLLPSRAWLNAVAAVQQQTAIDEVLGSSAGTPGQVFALVHGNVLGETLLEVDEGAPLPAGQERDLRSTGGAEAVRTEPANGRLPARTWVRWQRVSDFSASGPSSRNYVLDARAGRVLFGDGRRGRIPPGGPNNMVMRRYRSGGGAQGNLPAGSVVQLRSSLPYVASVKQPLPATGGHDAESAEAARGAATAWLRHRGRAVGPDDHEDLACRAAPEVARARCVPACDLAADPIGVRPAAGCVSLAIVPREGEPEGTDPAPQPSADLQALVHRFVAQRSAADARVVIVGPVYVRIDSEIEVLPVPGADAAALADACRRRITAFLHPVTGGPQGAGWPFGRWPYVSDVRGALAGLPGLAEVRQLRLRAVDKPDGARGAPHAVACAGRCTVRMAGWADECAPGPAGELAWTP